MPELEGKKYSYDKKGRAQYKAALKKLKKKRKVKSAGSGGYSA